MSTSIILWHYLLTPSHHHQSNMSLSYGNARAEAKRTTVRDASDNAVSAYLTKLDLPQGILPAVLKDFHALDSR